MLVKILFMTLFLTSVHSTLYNWNSFDLNSIPDYVDSIPTAKKIDIRENFVKKKLQKRKEQNLDRLIPNADDKIYVDGIAHFDLHKNFLKKAGDIESDFKTLLSMKTMKYTYKRGSHWRTWRQVQDTKGKKKIICYKCQNEVLPNCTKCESSGFWVIEESPPCPYEILSITKKQELCAVNYTQFNKKIGKCPMVIKYLDLTKSCDNPIVTVWRFVRNFHRRLNFTAPERKSIICGGRDYCEISTLYQIQTSQIIFRIINATEIIYSRVMKDNYQNFACVEDCGVIDFNTFKVRPKDKSTQFNLLPNKEKREDKIKTTKIREKSHEIKKHEAKPANKKVTKKLIEDSVEIISSEIEDPKNRNRIDELIEEFKINYKKQNQGKMDDNRIEKSLERGDDVRKRPGFHMLEPLPETTTKSHCRKIIDDMTSEEIDDDSTDDFMS